MSSSSSKRGSTEISNERIWKINDIKESIINERQVRGDPNIFNVIELRKLYKTVLDNSVDELFGIKNRLNYLYNYLNEFYAANLFITKRKSFMRWGFERDRDIRHLDPEMMNFNFPSNGEHKRNNDNFVKKIKDINSFMNDIKNFMDINKDSELPEKKKEIRDCSEALDFFESVTKDIKNRRIIIEERNELKKIKLKKLFGNLPLNPPQVYHDLDIGTQNINNEAINYISLKFFAPPIPYQNSKKFFVTQIDIPVYPDNNIPPQDKIFSFELDEDDIYSTDEYYSMSSEPGSDYNNSEPEEGEHDGNIFLGGKSKSIKQRNTKKMKKKSSKTKKRNLKIYKNADTKTNRKKRVS